MKKTLLAALFSIMFIATSCEKNEEIKPQPEPQPEVIVPNTNDKINRFIWRGLNLYYLWQNDVSDLADNKFNNFNDLYAYFRKYGAPEETFNNLLNKQGIIDRFSWIVDDYVALENSFQGINLSTGMEFGLVRYNNSNTNIYGFVRYVIPNSSAAISGVTRGMYFNTVNGSQLTDTNYSSLLFGNNSSLDLGFANFNEGNPVSNNTTISLTKTEVQENPIAISKIITDNNKKIGYLMYNQFVNSYDIELNNVFGNFKSEKIDDLIIDLRYNGGGSIASAINLGAMVTGQFTGQVYSKEVWNSKVLAAFAADNFVKKFPSKITKTDSDNNIIVEETINGLGLERVYFIVSRSTASASELIINSLNSYIDVHVVGTTTVGKQVGSITLYDSDNLSRNGENLSTIHTYAMQPLVLEITDKNGKNYPNGISPGENFTGLELKENFAKLGVLGERSDPLLDKTITYITTGKKYFSKDKNFIESEEIFNSKLATPISNNMYSELK